MKKNILLIFGVAILLSCGNTKNENANANNNASDTADMALISDNNNNASNSSDNWDQGDIKEFVEKASNGGLLEVKLADAAQKRALSQQVKDLGKMIATEHKDANDKLKGAIKALQLNAPTDLSKDYKDKLENLQKKNGQEFDKDYVDFLVDNHKSDIDDFEKAQANLPEGDLKMWVSNTLPVLRKHLAEAKYVQQQLKNESK